MPSAGKLDSMGDYSRTETESKIRANTWRMNVMIKGDKKASNHEAPDTDKI